jgi:hypothetical protein
VLIYEKPQLDDTDPFAKQFIESGVPCMLKEGYIALQVESHPIEFKKTELQVLE